MEFLCPDGAEVLFGYEHPYWSRYAAVTRNRFGSGCAYYLGCLPADKTIKAVLKRAATDAGVEAAPYEWPVIVRRGTNSLGREVVYVLNYSKEPVSVSNVFGTCTDLLTGRSYGSGEEIALSDWGVAVLEK
jgi:beta-galactosidase